MATLHTPLTLTIEYLKNTYESLQYVLDDQIIMVLEQLEREWITTTTHLEHVTRDTLLQKGFPAVFIDAVKPAPQHQLQPPQPLQHVEVDDDLIRMDNFFNNTNVAELTFGDDDSYWVENVEMLGWSRERLQGFYWRFCYSYMLCSIVAGFEDAHAAGRTLSLALTGVPGTGKSVLGAFVALVLSKVFGWRVTYKWGTKAVSFGSDMTLGKKITVLDLSAGDADVDLGSEFALIVASGDKQRWHHLAQQESWSRAKGNLVFIDPVPRQELADMAARLHRTKEFEKNYPVAGGAARVCFEAPPAVAAKVDRALDACREHLPGALRRLQRLDDGARDAGGTGAYPGLLAHFQPSSPYRNDAFLEVSSRYVEKKLAAHVWKRADADIERLLHELLGIPHVHSFASLIWEPLFTKKVLQRTGRLVISDCKLGPKGEGSPVLLDEAVGNLHHFEFKNLDDFVTKAKDWLDALAGGAGTALGKPVDYKFGAIDAVLVRVDGGACVLAGLQISVARLGYKPMECGVVGFAKMADGLKKTLAEGYALTKELWFLQPERGEGFRFEALQACYPKSAKRSKAAAQQQGLDGEEPAEAEDEPPKKKKRRRKLHIFSSKSFVVGATKQVQQFATVKFQDDATAADMYAGDVAAEVKTELKTEVGDDKPHKAGSLVPKEPSLRPWKSTMAICNQLAKHVHKDLAHVLKEDLDAEHQALGSLKAGKSAKRVRLGGALAGGKRGRRSDQGKGRKYGDQETAIAEFVNERWNAGVPTTRAEVYDVLRAREDCAEGTAFFNSYFAFGKEAGLASFLTRALTRINFSAQKNSIFPLEDVNLMVE